MGAEGLERGGYGCVMLVQSRRWEWMIAFYCQDDGN